MTSAVCPGADGIASHAFSSGAYFQLRGRRVRAWLTSAGIVISAEPSPWWAPWAALRSMPTAVFFEDILCASAQHSRGCDFFTVLVGRELS